MFTNEEKAECLNSYFASISTIDEHAPVLPPMPIKTRNTLTSISITESEIEDIIFALKVNKASGPDNISHKMLKGVVRTISKPLLCLQCCLIDLWMKVFSPILGNWQRNTPIQKGR